MAGSSTFPSASPNMQSSRSSVVIRPMVRSPCWTMYGVLRGAQYAANRSTSEQNTEIETGKDGRHDVSRECPEAFRQALKGVTAGGGRPALKVDNGWLLALTSLAVGTMAWLAERVHNRWRGCANRRCGYRTSSGVTCCRDLPSRPGRRSPAGNRPGERARLDRAGVRRHRRRMAAGMSSRATRRAVRRTRARFRARWLRGAGTAGGPRRRGARRTPSGSCISRTRHAGRKFRSETS